MNKHLMRFFKPKINIRIILILVSMSFLSSTNVTNDQSYGLQGKLLFYFSKFIEWPSDNNNSKFIIGVYGDVDIYEAISSSMKGRLMGGKPIAVRRYSTISQIESCDVFYLAANKSSNFYRAIGALKGNNTLLVTQKSGLGSKGSHINLTVVKDRLRFELNKSELDKAGLKVSSALVKQAIII